VLSSTISPEIAIRDYDVILQSVTAQDIITLARRLIPDDKNFKTCIGVEMQQLSDTTDMLNE
jgi:hypothetical protein